MRDCKIQEVTIQTGTWRLNRNRKENTQPASRLPNKLSPRAERWYVRGIIKTRRDWKLNRREEADKQCYIRARACEISKGYHTHVFKHQAMKMYWEVEVKLCSSFSLLTEYRHIYFHWILCKSINKSYKM
jgi:hypothetical protein